MLRWLSSWSQALSNPISRNAQAKAKQKVPPRSNRSRSRNFYIANSFAMEKYFSEGVITVVVVVEVHLSTRSHKQSPTPSPAKLKLKAKPQLLPSPSPSHSKSFCNANLFAMQNFLHDKNCSAVVVVVAVVSLFFPPPTQQPIPPACRQA